jgi:hypothetical protein
MIRASEKKYGHIVLKASKVLNLRMQAPHHLILVDPRDFSYNDETSVTNSFQCKVELENISAKVQQEFTNVVNVLCEHKIAHTVFGSPANVNVPDAIFPNNWFAVLPTGQLIIFPMQAQNRRNEVNEEIIQFIATEFKGTDFIDLRPNVDSGVFLEGTGSIVFDHLNKIAFAAESPRTNIQLFNALCKHIGYKPISFLAVDLKGQPIYHTNVLMSVGTNSVVICLECIPDPIERAMLKQTLIDSKKDIIEIGFAQMNAFCANLLEVKNSKEDLYWLMSERAKNAFTAQQINQLSKGSTIVSCNIHTIETVGGGGIRCMLAGIHATLK